MKLKDIIASFQLSKDEKEKIIESDRIAHNCNFNNIPQDGNYVPESFKTIAQCIISGHFEIKEGNEVVRKVYPTCVEIYYHEEAEDAIKDYIVYHRNKSNNTPDTFRPGSFNTHQSGIDITFEHPDCNGNVVRASALIRKYRMEDARYEEKSPLYVKNKKIDDRSTYLYEALFADLSIIKGFSIQWIDGEELKEIAEPTYRKNVLPYDKETLQKDKESREKNDGRRWQFSIKEENNE